MVDDTGKMILSQRSWRDVFRLLFWSKGLLLVLVVAPAFWALLPFAYEYIKQTDAFVRANPMFLVFARMTVGCLWMLSVLGFLRLFSRFKGSLKGNLRSVAVDVDAAFGAVHRNLQGQNGLLRSRMFWCLICLGVVYVLARAIEMILILGYGNAWTVNMTPSALGALKDYGYFMGLMLAVPLTFVIGSFSKSNTLTSFIFGVTTIFLTLASGLLYVCAENPDGVQGLNFCWMSIIAIIVSFFTYLASVCKGKGNLSSSGENDVPTFWTILIASIKVNLIMSCVAAVLSFVGSAIWLSLFAKDVGVVAGLIKLGLLYWNPALILPLIIVVGLGATVVAPIAQLCGVSLHDKSKSSLAKFGVGGKDWLMICGGFEPLFVAAFMFIARGWLSKISWMQKCLGGGSELYSNMLMFMAVLTVLVIALLKIAEVWAEKDSVLRNVIFTGVRGSSQDLHANLCEDDLRLRAMRLTLLKFFAKQSELATRQLELLQNPNWSIKELLKRDDVADGVVVFIGNGRDFFTQDDPFTNDVLASQAHYLEKPHPGVHAVSLHRYVKNVLKRTEDDWKKTVRPAASVLAGADGENAMPFVVYSGESGGDIKGYVDDWAKFLDELNNVVSSGAVGQYVNGMIDDYCDETKRDKMFNRS